MTWMTHLQSVEEGRLSSSVETENENSHFAAAEQVSKVTEKPTHPYSKLKTLTSSNVKLKNTDFVFLKFQSIEHNFVDSWLERHQRQQMSKR
jgi:hypothetical protein